MKEELETKTFLNCKVNKWYLCGILKGIISGNHTCLESKITLYSFGKIYIFKTGGGQGILKNIDATALYSFYDDQETKGGGAGPQYLLQGHTSSDLTSYLLKVPQPPSNTADW